MNLPSSWHDVKLYQFKELRQLSDVGGFFNTQLETLAILADVPTEELEDLDLEEISKLFKSVKWVLNEPKKGLTDVLTIDDDTYILKPFKKLTLDEFIDLEYLLPSGFHFCLLSILSDKNCPTDAIASIIIFSFSMLSPFLDKVFRFVDIFIANFFTYFILKYI